MSKAKEIDIDDLAAAVYEAYRTGVEEIHESVMVAADECATDCLESIRDDSPADTGDYKKGWVKRKTKEGYYIYNKNKPHLEMILEHGRVVTRGPNKGQRIPGKPHIYKNADKYKERFYDMCVKIVAEGARFSKE